MNNKEEKTTSRFRYRGSLVGPIIIITIGIVFLLNNLGYLSGNAWETILNLWPVILIAIGLDSVLHNRGVAGPTLFIGLGIIFLLSNFGMLGWNVWDLILKLWPILLIAIGLDIVLGRRSIWGAGLALILILVILVGTLWYFDVGPGVALTDEISVVQPIDSISEVGITLQPSVGSLRIKALNSSKNLLEGIIHKWKGEDIYQEYKTINTRADFSLRSEGVNISLPVSLPSEADWELKINKDIPAELDTKLGVGKLDVNLNDLQIIEFSINVAVGTVNVILPTKGRLSGSVENAIGNVIITIPRNTACRITMDAGLTNIQTPSGYQHTGNIYTSPGYASAENRVDLIVNQAIGFVRINSEGANR